MPGLFIVTCKLDLSEYEALTSTLKAEVACAIEKSAALLTRRQREDPRSGGAKAVKHPEVINSGKVI
jgi:hypothetical protein